MNHKEECSLTKKKDEKRELPNALCVHGKLWGQGRASQGPAEYGARSAWSAQSYQLNTGCGFYRTCTKARMRMGL